MYVPPQRLYRANWEKTKAKIHVPPDMLDVVAARNTQKMISGVDYRKYLHQWICLPDMQVYVHARKVNEQLSDVRKWAGLTFYIQYMYKHTDAATLLFLTWLCNWTI